MEEEYDFLMALNKRAVKTGKKPPGILVKRDGNNATLKMEGAKNYPPHECSYSSWEKTASEIRYYETGIIKGDYDAYTLWRYK